jgi:cholesterol transport system auxiliary component
MRLGLSRFLALAACLAVGACAAAIELARPDPPRLYALTPKSTFADDLPDVDTRISVEVPTATAGLNTAQIALRPTATSLEYYARARWIDVVPVMVQNLLLESLDNAASLDVVGREAVGIRADYALLTHIREFQAEYIGEEEPPRIQVRLQARLVRLPRRTSIAATSAAFTVNARDRSMQAIVAAFDDGLGKALRRIVEWTVREIDRAEVSAVSGG